MCVGCGVGEIEQRKQTKKETLKVKHVNNNPNPTNKTWSPNVASSVPKISPSKSPKSSNMTRQLYRQGSNVVNPYRKTEPHFDNLASSTSTMSSNVSWFQSSRKTTTNGTSLGIKPSPTKVSLINSIDETNRRQRYASQPKSEIISESTQNKLHAYKIDWADINITTAEAMKYPNFTKIK